MNTKDQPRDWADVIVEELIDHWIDIDLPLDFEKTIAQALRDVEEKRMRLDAKIAQEKYLDASTLMQDHEGCINFALSVGREILSARLGEGE